MSSKSLNNFTQCYCGGIRKHAKSRAKHRSKSGSSTKTYNADSSDCERNKMKKNRTPSEASRRLGNLNPVFHMKTKEEDNCVITKSMIFQIHHTGSLNLSNKNLSTVPDKVYEINDTKDTEVTLEALTVKEEDAWWNQIPLTTLDLSSNTLTHISPKIENLSSLTCLTLHNNALTCIPPEIGKLEKLTRINLSRNCLKELPAEFFTLPELRILNLAHNKLEKLSPDISDLHMLESLDVSHNELCSVPCGIGFLVRLTELILPYNHIKKLPTDLVDMRCLRKLDLMHNDLDSLPDNMGRLRKLECLYIQHNDIKTLPEFDGCTNLQELHASNNFLLEIPTALCSNLPHLKIFDLRDNHIKQIPEEIVFLQNLTRLDITNNSISSLPCSLSCLAHLISLQVEGNPIKSIRRDILQRGTTRILKTLRDRAEGGMDKSRKSMCGDGLNSPRTAAADITNDSIFPDKYKLRKTHWLAVTKQNLVDVPDDIFEIAKDENVNIVDFSKNRLGSLPKGLQKMCHCANELVFANNLIRKIDPFISQFTRINLINLSCNYLSDLPEEFGILNTLRELNISNNRFDNLPACIYKLQSLEILLVRDNQVNAIDASPEGLGALKRLATLDLRNNNISQVPPILGNLMNITSLDIIGNPFRQPRHQVLEKGTEAIMSYLRDRIPT